MRNKHGLEKKCARCGDDEWRVDGYCSCECRDKHELAQEITTLRARIAELEALLVKVDMDLRGAMVWAGSNWGAPSSVEWALSGAYQRLTNRLAPAEREVIEAAIEDMWRWAPPEVPRAHERLWNAVAALLKERPHE